MNCLVTAGPTYEPLDAVRRLTNFSTGKLGSRLADFLVDRGHTVTLLLGQYATFPGPHRVTIEIFTTTADLAHRIQRHSADPVQAVFHAAAVSDFAFGQIWKRTADGALHLENAGKLSTRSGTLLAELVPTQKLIASMRDWFPRACVVGWKYEVDGGRASVIEKAERQLRECRLDASVANGKAYGAGFGLVDGPGQCTHHPDATSLFGALARLIEKGSSESEK